MEFWIDIENASGVAYGPGPITTATGWQHTSRLDGAGEFSFTMPASDPMSTHLANKRVVRCRGILDGAITELGLGIIDKISVTPGNPTMVTVSGPDIMAELVDRSVHSLVVCEQQWTDLSDANSGLLAWVRVSETGVPSPTVAIPNAHDGNASTYETIYLMSEKVGFPQHSAWLYVGYDARFDRIKILFAGGDYADNVHTLQAQYYNGSGWASLSVTDGTIRGGGTFRQNGDITFTRPADWARYYAVEAGGDWFWVRMRIARRGLDDPSSTGYFKLAEVDVYADVPTTNGVNLVMAYAPDTWTKTGYPATVSTKYLEFHGESVLEALLILSEQGGTDGSDAVREHFRYNPASPREVDWLGTTVTPSGVRAVAPVDAITAESASELVVIQNLTRVIDSAEVVTRIYPRTLDGITLALATVGAATGYTHNTASNYIQHTAGYNAYGLIERHVEFSELSLQQADSYTTHPTDLANQLHERATEFLRTHGVLNYFYQLSVLQFPALLMAGDTIECVYHEYTDGVHTVNIDTVAAGTPLHILAPTIQITSQGIATIGLEVATIDRAPKSDAGVIVDLVRQQKRSGVAASNLVTILGTVLPPPPGELGGWSIGDLAIENNDAVLHSDGWIQLGSGDNIIRMDAQDVGYRMWAGAPLGADAPFSITVDGNLHAENAYIEGEIVADTGAIGGFVIGADHVKDLADSFGLSSVVTGGDDVRFWAGDTFANRASAPFRVTKAGLLTAQGATIEGDLTATTGELVNLDVTGTLKLIDPAVIKSSNYITGAKGWKIDAKGDAELWNVKVRGELRSAVLVYEETGVLGGDLVLAKSAGTLSGDYTVGDVMVVDGNAWRFATNDIVHIRAWDAGGTNLGDTWLAVFRTATVNHYTTQYKSGSTGLTYPAGTAVADYGVSGQGIVQLTSRAPLGPSVSIQTSSVTPWAGVTEHARLGNLRNSFGVGDVDKMGLALGNYAGNQYIRWDGADLRVSGKVYVYPGGTKTLADWTHPSDHTLIDGGNIYANTVTVTAGKVTLPGSTKTLADWAHSSDTTLIDGGNIYANSITASKITMRGSNYLGNPGFETGDTREWTIAPGRNVSVLTTNPHSGGYYCRVEGTGANAVALSSEHVPAGPGDRWFGAAWMRVSAAGSVALRIAYYNASHTYLSHVQKQIDTLSSTWTRVQVEGTVPTKGAYVILQLVTYDTLAVGEYVAIDSCELIKSDVSVNITDDIKLNLDGLHLLDVSIWTGWGMDSKHFSLYTSYESGHNHTVSFSIVGHRIKINDVWHIAIAM